MGWKHKKLCPFFIPFDYPDYSRNPEKETKENPPYAPTLYSGSSLCYSIHWNIPPYLLDIYLKLLAQIVILYFISFNYPIGISFFRFFFYLFLDFNLSSHWNLPLSFYLFDDLMNYPIGFYLSLFKYRFRFLNYSFWWSVPLSLDFFKDLIYLPIGLYLCFFKINFNERIKCLVVRPPFLFFISFSFVDSILTHR